MILVIYQKALNDWPLDVSRGKAERNIEVEGKQNSLFPAGQVIEFFVIPPNSNMEKTAKKSFP